MANGSFAGDVAESLLLPDVQIVEGYDKPARHQFAMKWGPVAARMGYLWRHSPSGREAV